jgi:hypothetical protein
MPYHTEQRSTPLGIAKLNRATPEPPYFTHTAMAPSCSRFIDPHNPLTDPNSTSLTLFSVTLLDTLSTELTTQISRYTRTQNFFHSSFASLTSAASLPDAEAAEMQCLAHLSTIETLISEFEMVLAQIDVDVLVAAVGNVGGEEKKEEETWEMIEMCVGQAEEWLGGVMDVDAKREYVWRMAGWKGDELGRADSEQE